MKKTLLSIAAILMASYASQAQFVETTTSVTYSGNSVPSGTPGFYSYQAYPATKFSEGTCTTPFSGTLGGFDGTIYDATTVTPARTKGVIFYGGAIANVYAGTPCTANMPSFGFNVTGVNLSAAANQKITFDYQSDKALSLELQVKDVFYNAMLSSTPFNLIGDGAVHSIQIDFSSKVLTGADLSSIRQISLSYPSSTLSPSFGASIGNIKLGSVAVITGINNSTSVANANLFPNPATGSATITGELKSVADVKITLVDMLGQEVKVILEERTSTINTTFDVSTLKKGIYSVVTNIDGAPSKSQMLVVR